jgi:hypothetical protein
VNSLGEIVAALTDPARAEAALASVAAPAVADRIARAASAQDMAVGAFVAEKVGRVVEDGGADIWLELAAAMGRSPQPAVAAVGRMLAHAFPARAFPRG